MKDSGKNRHVGNILLFIIDLWLNSLQLWVSETIDFPCVAFTYMLCLSMAGRYMWLNWGQPKEEKLKYKTKRRVRSLGTSMLLLWPISWGTVATLFSTPVQLPDALIDFWACFSTADFQGQGCLHHQRNLWTQVAGELLCVLTQFASVELWDRQVVHQGELELQLWWGTPSSLPGVRYTSKA